MSREVEFDGVFYPSLAAAGRAEGVSAQTIRAWLGLDAARPYRYETPIRGIVYPSIAAASQATGVDKRVIARAAQRGTLDKVGTRKFRGKQMMVAE